VNDIAKSVSAAFSNGDDVASHVSQLLERIGQIFRLPAEVLQDLSIALDEVVTNIVSYAYVDEESHDITIHCEIRDGNLETTIEDDGVAYDPLRAPPPDLDAPIATRRVGGLGVYFVKKLMKSVSYERVEGRNRLTLKQDLEKPAGESA
jgi:anti-sigma regulatory factor (Ser/Thr protein kinase)